ncbi:antitoxin (DNA-binding transcriptional repressor) of toxin-antitoxin stability system [Paraburkholderia sp. BL6669N2]|uniref:type II toxin-antitoxin system Phd/YefM family antitoxin n=1 Tax=Paraburkholderia sp. BL6669N2 TaxID=1938807 RepID=UPI000E242D20|nr:type II toxin-antitoxin system Phd/YefM family antitoxin [Paraburkholderia sp. BL6669N2]REG49560.1 antitoxin (DNA-binding transcriptional repressor) of toxin-antitoxin stability system [Paraburkholderia sp. BL6669N2]
MEAISILRAKSILSRLVDAIEGGLEREIIISRNGRPVARLVPMERAQPEKRIGVAKGKFEVPDSIDASNREISELFLGKGSS